MSPLEQIRSWYDACPNAIQQNIAAFVRTLILDPNYNTTPWSPDNFVSAFKEYTTTPSGSPAKLATQRAVYLKALINSVMSNKMTEADWERSRNIIQQVENAERLEGSFDESTSLLIGHDERKKEWMSKAAEWRVLCETALTDDNLLFFAVGK